jgi:transaldolase
MKPTETLRNKGQSLWLDNITRGMLDAGDIARLIDTHSVSGLTSNPSIFDNAIATGQYDEAIKAAAGRDLSNEEVFFTLAIADLQRAADLFAPIHERTSGVDGWVSLEVSPLLAYDTARTIDAAKSLHERAHRPNLFVKIPGTPQGLGAIEECIASGIPVNVTLLFDAGQFRAAADAYLRGVERRVASGIDPNVGCVASVFVSRWDTAVATSVPEELHNQLGLAVAHDTYHAYCDLMASARFERLANAGARVQRLLWASTKTKDPAASDTLYVNGLVAPLTINTMPNATLEAFFDHGDSSVSLARDGGDCDTQLERFSRAGVDVKALARKLQDEGAASFTSSWNDLLAKIDAQSAATKDAR